MTDVVERPFPVVTGPGRPLTGAAVPDQQAGPGRLAVAGELREDALVAKRQQMPLTLARRQPHELVDFVVRLEPATFRLHRPVTDPLGVAVLQVTDLAERPAGHGAVPGLLPDFAEPAEEWMLARRELALR